MPKILFYEETNIKFKKMFLKELELTIPKIRVEGTQS